MVSFHSTKTFLAIGAVAIAGLLFLPAVAAKSTPSHVMNITAHEWAFSPATITVDVDQPETLMLKSKDVTHGIASSELGIPNTQIVKGKTSKVTFTPKKIGTYKVQCSVYCGMGHANMILTVHVVQ